MKNRGFHNYMQRRAQYRCPSRDPRTFQQKSAMPRLQLGALLANQALLQRHFEHRHRRPVDLAAFKKALEQLEHRISRLDSRKARAWRRFTGEEQLFGATPRAPRVPRSYHDRFIRGVGHIYGNVTVTSSTQGTASTTWIPFSADSTATTASW